MPETLLKPLLADLRYTELYENVIISNRVLVGQILAREGYAFFIKKCTCT